MALTGGTNARLIRFSFLLDGRGVRLGDVPVKLLRALGALLVVLVAMFTTQAEATGYYKVTAIYYNAACSVNQIFTSATDFGTQCVPTDQGVPVNTGTTCLFDNQTRLYAPDGAQGTQYAQKHTGTTSTTPQTYTCGGQGNSWWTGATAVYAAGCPAGYTDNGTSCVVTPCTSGQGRNAAGTCGSCPAANSPAFGGATRTFPNAAATATSCATDTVSGLSCQVTLAGIGFPTPTATSPDMVGTWGWTGNTCGGGTSLSSSQTPATPTSSCYTIASGVQACVAAGGSVTFNGTLVTPTSNGGVSSNGASLSPGSSAALPLGASASSGELTTPNTTNPPATAAVVSVPTTTPNSTVANNTSVSTVVNNTFNYSTPAQVTAAGGGGGGTGGGSGTGGAANTGTGSSNATAQNVADGSAAIVAAVNANAASTAGKLDAIAAKTSTVGLPGESSVPSFGDSAKSFYTRVKNAPLIAPFGSMAIVGGGQCPSYTLDIPYFHQSYAFNQWCTVASGTVGSLLRLVMLAFWAVIAIRKFLEA